MTAYLTFPWRATSLLGFFLSTSAMVLGPPLAILLVIIGFLSYKSIGRMLALHVFKTDPYVHLPRPKHSDRLFPIFGDLYTVFKSPPTVPLLRWAKEVNSSVYVYRGLFYSPRLLLADSRAMLHVLSAANSYSYPKPQGTRRALKSILGEGVLVAEGDTHKKQRKLLQPAFSISAIRDLYPIFSHHSEALAIKIGDMIDRSSNASSKMKDQSKADGVNKPFRHQNELCLEKSVSGKPVIDVSPWLTKATLDIV
ncbi:hypothetical protein IE53DRAFT_60060 [Violaceomyces palustris]|uniref:Uncharacterized protein n=1 Tax=Violaceomyces palustris TaxID=1673888 RepID=A0ACD0P7C3_9BASI|nr:hypothetical protein IE53DRAFT_60060 [Violaceomyces palustris]